jgi:hypothetical protein
MFIYTVKPPLTAPLVTSCANLGYRIGDIYVASLECWQSRQSQVISATVEGSFKGRFVKKKFQLKQTLGSCCSTIGRALTN